MSDSSGVRNPPHDCSFACGCAQSLSDSPWTVAHQAPLSVGFSRQEYCSRVLVQEIFPDPGIKPTSPALQVDSLPLHRLGSLACLFSKYPLPAWPPTGCCPHGAKSPGEESGWRCVTPGPRWLPFSFGLCIFFPFLPCG